MPLSAYTKKLISDPNALSIEEIDNAFNIILHSNEVPEVQIASFLTAARVTGRDHKADFIATVVSNLLKEAKKIDFNTDLIYADIVGTGGDGKDTFNVSTTSAIVVAGTGLVKVAKHGGPASTSASGASDLLANLGIDLSKVTNTTVSKLLANDFTYMSGPIFHPILARVKTIRKQLGIPTIFNLVGPLLNPAPISSRILGVYTSSLGKTYAEAARALFRGGSAMVVCGSEGLDEISPAGDTYTWTLDSNGEINESVIHPRDFGLPTHPLTDVAGGSPKENALLVRELVANKLSENHPIKDYVLMNSAALLYVSGVVTSLKEGVQRANESITNGGAARALRDFEQSVSQL